MALFPSPSPGEGVAKGIDLYLLIPSPHLWTAGVPNCSARALPWCGSRGEGVHRLASSGPSRSPHPTPLPSPVGCGEARDGRTASLDGERAQLIRHGPSLDAVRVGKACTD